MVTPAADDGPAGAVGEVAPQGYTLVLPPGWGRVPVRVGTDRAVDAILERAFSALPRDTVVTLRRDLRRRLDDLVERAREGSALDVYLPVERAGDVVLTCSFVVSEIHDPGPREIDAAVVLARLLAGERTHPVELSAGLGARSERSFEAEAEADHASRRVDYVLPVPRDPDRWVTVSFSTLGAGSPTDDFAGLQVELFDAIMTTFRWQS